MIFGGSSVTAGHDNHYNQSYPEVFKRRITPIFNSMGIKLIVRNIAQGANNCAPYDYCYTSMGGDTADWVGWEQSFNCGREPQMFELVARIAGWVKAVVYFAASGGAMPSDCSPSPVRYLSVHCHDTRFYDN